MFIHKIKNEEGDWIQGDAEVTAAACKHFQDIFT